MEGLKTKQMNCSFDFAAGRPAGNFCGRRRCGRGPADGALAAAAAAAKIEKQITSGRPPVKKKLAPDGRTDEKNLEKIKVCLKR